MEMHLVYACHTVISQVVTSATSQCTVNKDKVPSKHCKSTEGIEKIEEGKVMKAKGFYFFIYPQSSNLVPYF